MPRPKGSGIPAGGAGWGGPKTGVTSNSKAGIPGPGRPKGSVNGVSKATRAREALEAAQPLAIQTVIDIASRLDDQRSLAAALAILNRTGLHEKSGVEHSGEGGGPLIVERIIVSPEGRDTEGV